MFTKSFPGYRAEAEAAEEAEELEEAAGNKMLAPAVHDDQAPQILKTISLVDSD